MKKIKWVNDNRMLFESDHKTFNRQTNIISTGNIIANTVIGQHIRAYTETECNGLTRSEGHLRNFDLQGFMRRHIPRRVLQAVKDSTANRSAWLYELLHYNNMGLWKDDQRIVHGYVLTSGDHFLIRSFVTGPTWKSRSVVNEATKYLAHVTE